MLTEDTRQSGKRSALPSPSVSKERRIYFQTPPAPLDLRRHLPHSLVPLPLRPFLLVWIVPLRGKRQQARDGRASDDDDDDDDRDPNTNAGYQSLRALMRWHQRRPQQRRQQQRRQQQRQRRVRFARTHVEHPPPPPSPVPPPAWRSRFYEPARQRFNTTVVDGVYVRHNFSSSGHSIADSEYNASSPGEEQEEEGQMEEELAPWIPFWEVDRS